MDTHAGGRPLDGKMTARILEEIRRSLSADGYSSLRIERIAAAIGCGKAAIYRRWPNKAELVAAAVASEIYSEADQFASDTGDVGEDLIQHVLQTSRRYSSDTPGVGAAWAAMGERDVVEILWQGPLKERRKIGLNILDRGIKRGQLPAGVDGNLILDLLAGMSLYRHKIRFDPPDESHYRASVTSLMANPPLLQGTTQSPAVITL